MTDLKLNYPPGATPLDPDELHGLNWDLKIYEFQTPPCPGPKGR